MNKPIAVALAAVCSLFTFLAEANTHVVLFKQAEIAVTSLEHGQFQEMLRTTNQKSVDQLEAWMSGRGAGNRASKVDDLWLIRGAVAELSVDEAKQLAREPWVAGVHQNKLRRMIPATSTLKVAGSLKELGESEGQLWGLSRIGIPKIRAEFPNLDGTGVRIGIIDTGIQSNHPELKKRLVGFRDFVNHIPNPYDDQGHGTHVAGTIGGTAVGVAPGASFLVAKVFSAAGSAFDDEILAAMQWMFDPDLDPQTNDYPRIVSNSWGGDLGTTDAVNISDFAAYHLAIQAWIYGGIVPVFAAGNSGTIPNGFPGGLPEPIAVGALSPQGMVAEFSSRGPNLWKMGATILTVLKPDITAPGEKITSAFPGNKYATWDGTSMATPHVSGAVGLLLQANPKLRFADVKQLMLKTSERRLDIHYGYGILDAYALVKAGVSR